MTQSLVVHEGIRKDINFIEEIQHQEVDEGFMDTIKKIAGKAKAAIAPDAEQQGAKELNNVIDAYFRWLSNTMGKTGITWDTLTFGNMRNFLSSPINKLNLNRSPGGAVDKVFAKVKAELNVPDTKDTELLGANKATSQKVAKSILKHGIITTRAQDTGLEKQEPDIPVGQIIKTRKNEFERTARGWILKGQPTLLLIQQQDKLNDLYKQMRERGMIDETRGQKSKEQTAEWGLPKWLTKQAAASPATTKPVTLNQPTSVAPTSAQPVPATPAPKSATPAEPFTMQADIKGQTVKVTKVEPSAKAPSGWYYWHPEYKTWVYPAKDSQDAKVFDQYYAAKTMNEATKSEINARLDHLGAARQAEKQGDKALQYEKLADYHTEFSKVNKLKPADRIHHTTQAGIYRNAAQAVRSAQETLAKSSK